LLSERVGGWERTKRGGVRRTGVAQIAKSAAQMQRRSVGRIHPPVPRWFTQTFSWEWAKPLGLPECPYVIRWMVETPAGSVRLHHWLAPDDDRARHDHPWWFVTFVLRGFYFDVDERGWSEFLHAPAVRFRPALHRHTVVPGPEGCWTVIVTGPKSRAWGFWREGKFYKANKWFAKFGHHPCSSTGSTTT
jgi:hypothetical protein